MSKIKKWVFYSDTKKFGKGKKRKNHRAKIGYSYPKEYRKERRKDIKQLRHKILFRIPLTEEEQSNVEYYTKIYSIKF